MRSTLARGNNTASERRLGAAKLVTATLLLGVLTGLAPSCSSGDSGGGTSAIPCAVFQGSGIPAPLTVTASDGSSGNCDLLYVDLTVTDVSDLFAANFVATFPSGIVSFSTVSSSGSVLTSGGTSVTVQATESNPGELTVGISRVGVDSGIDVMGGARLARLIFVRTGSTGSGALSFTSGELLNSGDPMPPPTVIPGSVWIGGTVGIAQQ